MVKYKRAKVAVSIPYGDGRHAAEPAGAVISVAEVAEYMQAQFAENDPWLNQLFESATESDFEAYTGFVERLAQEEAEPESEKEDEEPEEVHPQKAQRRRAQKVQTQEETTS